MLALCENPTREADTLPLTHSNLEGKMPRGGEMPRGGKGGDDVKKRAGGNCRPSLGCINERLCC